MDIKNNSRFNFNDLFIFEMANNHQGLLEHGLRIVDEMEKAISKFSVRAAFKFQFRDINTFIHPDFKDDTANKHIQRFISTRLEDEEFKQILNYVKSKGFLSICTPFDELSVEKIEKMGFDIIKVASCSANDWPLLERIAQSNKPVICSVGGLKIKDIDKVVSFFQHRGVDFALEHCVAVYPTPMDKLDLGQIAIMRDRYRGITIGFSTHEEPFNLTAIKIAYAKGARIFEKHVGFPTDTIKLNSYSANPEQIAKWLNAYKEAVEACGREEERIITDQELADLKSLQRGIYAKNDILAGSIIKNTDVFFAMPIQSGQLFSGDWREDLVADKNYKLNEPISKDVAKKSESKASIIYSAIHSIKGMINHAKIPLSHEFYVEISHHYGLERFREIGCVIIECIMNREYAKKLIVQLPGQTHPVHYHKAKDETFQILFGSLEVEIGERRKKLYSGDILWVPRGVWHGFSTEEGVIIEEISTTVSNGDSFYIDKSITSLPRESRKTRLDNWGSYQMF